MTSKPLRALTPLQDKILTLLVYASNRDGGRDPYVSTAELWQLAERLDPAANHRTIEHRCVLAAGRLIAEGVVVKLDCGSAPYDQLRIVRSLPGAARISLLYSRTADNEANPPTRRKHHARGKQTQRRQPGDEPGRAAVDAQRPTPEGRQATFDDGTGGGPVRIGPLSSGAGTIEPVGSPGEAPESAPQDDAQPVLDAAYAIKAPKPQPDPNERL